LKTTATKTLRPAFTIIEILVSVLIISVSIIYVLKIHSSNREQIIYISERNKRALSDSLFLSREVLRHHKEKRSAYDLLERERFKIKELKSREILKKEEREIFIPEEIVIVPPPDVPGPSAVVNEVKLKGEHSSNYWHFKITNL